MSNIGWIELLVIVAGVTILIMVPKNLPKLTRRLREAIRHRRKRGRETGDDFSAAGSEADPSDKAE